MSGYVEILSKLKDKDFYVYLDKENPDWRGDEETSLFFHFPGERMVLPLSNLEQTSYLASSLYHVVGQKNFILSWGIKDVFSYLKGKTEIKLELNAKIYDLKLMSSYLGINSERPGNFREAVNILRTCLSDPRWPVFEKYYFGVFDPLFSSVLPDIETCCLVDNKRRICVYPTYVMEGQLNGRLKTARVGSSSYNPHSMGPEEKHNLRPSGYDEVFVYMDYMNMEVNVLQWLSGDEELKKILDSGKDLYKEIWRRIIKQEPTDAHRKLCKDIFLPVVFGQGRASLAEKLGTSEENASRIIHSLGKTFHVAFDWVKSQSTDSNNIATDAFGRRRKFKDHEHYKIKNFCIQSPASMICLRKLVRLHEALSGSASVCYHLHDGYCVLCKKNEINMVSELGVSILEEEDLLFSNLFMKVSCQGGSRLDDMQTLTLTKRMIV